MNREILEKVFGNRRKRELRREMRRGIGITDDFFKWANTYFVPKPENYIDWFSPADKGYFDTYIDKRAALDKFLEVLSFKQRRDFRRPIFGQYVRMWCKYYGYKFNPEHLINDKDNRRIMRRRDTESEEFFFISTAKKNEHPGAKKITKVFRKISEKFRTGLFNSAGHRKIISIRLQKKIVKFRLDLIRLIRIDLLRAGFKMGDMGRLKAVCDIICGFVFEHEADSSVRRKIVFDNLRNLDLSDPHAFIEHCTAYEHVVYGMHSSPNKDADCSWKFKWEKTIIDALDQMFGKGWSNKNNVFVTEFKNCLPPGVKSVNLKSICETILFCAKRNDLVCGKPGHLTREFNPETDILNAYRLEFHLEPSQDEINLFCRHGIRLTKELFAQFKCKSVYSYEFSEYSEEHGKNIVHRFTSNYGYPIFAFDYDGYYKMYCPLEEKKTSRLRYVGEKPKSTENEELFNIQ
ncbi:MAG: hypothetical protein LBL13_11935 [Bacteroidales bacterium]|jgi:hypothetical protein|nr:hypothetical protein [Bacteroidales bacterium]